MKTMMTACGLAAAAGLACAQPVIDGSLAGDESVYGPILFVQDTPTEFGDNSVLNCDPADVGNVAAVDTGVEIRIPLSALGSPANLGDVDLVSWITSGFHDFHSNQFLPALDPGTPNLGEARNVDLEAQGTGSINLGGVSAAGSAPTLDGTRDGSYTQLALQANRTGFGDNDNASSDIGAGSELSGVYATTFDGDLYLFFAGVIESNGNKLDIFFDSRSGGQNVLPETGNYSGDNFALQRMGTDTDGDDSDGPDGPGLTFPAGFEADYWVTTTNFNKGDTDPATIVLHTYYAELGTGDAGGFFVGETLPTSGTAPIDADSGAPAILATLDNSSVDGVLPDCPPPTGNADFANGSEINGVYGTIDTDENKLYLLVTGNLETNFNRLVLFFDSNPEGQNTLTGLGQNPDFSNNNGLNRLGTLTAANDPGDFGPEGPGLTFDAGFDADYIITFNTGGAVPVQFSDATSILTNPLIIGTDTFLQYAGFNGGEKPDNNPIDYDGTQLDSVNIGTTFIRTQYAPFIATEALVDLIDGGAFPPVTPPAPPAGLILLTIDNSNLNGVTDSDASDAANVTTGVELAIDLDEINWDGESDILVAGAVSNSNMDFFSNQVLGGLGGASNLGEPRAIDFSAIAGNQFVTISAPGTGGCNPADLSSPTSPGEPDGVLTGADFFEFLARFSSGDLSIDFSSAANPGVPDGVLTGADFFEFLNLFSQGC